MYVSKQESRNEITIVFQRKRELVGSGAQVVVGTFYVREVFSQDILRHINILKASKLSTMYLCCWALLLLIQSSNFGAVMHLKLIILFHLVIFREIIKLSF